MQIKDFKFLIVLSLKKTIENDLKLFLEEISFIDLDQGSEMIIFESILTTFIASIILEAAGAVAKLA